MGVESQGAGRHFGVAPVVFLAATLALQAGEMQSFAQAIDGPAGLKAAFHVSDAALGLVPFAMSVIGVAGTLPAGILTDRVRRTSLMACLVATWGLVEGLNGLVAGFAMFVILRILVAIAESTNPVGVSLVADYFPVTHRARMMGYYQLGGVVGAILGAVLGGVLMAVGGWRWTFLVWVPIGLAATAWSLRQPEPPRGARDAEFESGLAAAAAELDVPVHHLPPPSRVSTVDYAGLGGWAAFRELWRSTSFRYGTAALVVINMQPLGLAFWGVPYFKRVHHLSAATAGGVTGLIAAGTIGGVLAGGVIADRLLERGVLNARVWVLLVGAVAAGGTFTVAFASTSLPVSALLVLVAASFLGITIAPGETMVTDVVVAELRGRASTVRFSAGAISTAGAALIGLLSTALGLRLALVVFSPVLALGALLCLPALRSYPGDVAFVVAESRRRREATLAPPTSRR